MRKHDVVNLRGLEWSVSGQRVIESSGQAVHVSEECLRFTTQLLGSNVVRGSPNLLGVIHSCLRFAGQTKIDQLRLAVHVEQNIPWLDVAMQQIMLQGDVQC